jgi:hypothetical protein
MSILTFLAAAVVAFLVASEALAADPARAFAAPNTAAIAAARAQAGAKGALPPIAGQAGTAGRAIAAPEPATMPGAVAGPAGRLPSGVPSASELGMIRVQNITSERQRILSIGTNIVSSLQCKDCLNNMGK